MNAKMGWLGPAAASRGETLLGSRGIRVVVVVGGVAGLLAVAGCGTLASAFQSGSRAVIAISPTNSNSSDVGADAPVVVKASGGSLVAVAVSGPDGLVPGSLDDGGARWVSEADSLDFGAEYKVSARAVDEDGEQVSKDLAFTTMSPENEAGAYLKYVSDGEAMGVGMPLRLEFNDPVENRREVEQNLSVSTGRELNGAWSWDEDGKAVTFRPQQFWPAHNVVLLEAGLKGVELAPGRYGAEDLKAKLKIGSRMISLVDAESLTMTVARDGEVIAELPVTTGKAGFETREGIKPIMAKEGTVVMDAASGGTSRSSSEYYRLTVRNSMRLTWSGEYVHAAPWSTGSQGRRNVSHGCIGMSSSDASWFYGISDVGDLVVVTNSGRDQDANNGITAWDTTWADWLASSETGPRVIPATPALLKETETNQSSESSETDS